MCSLINAQRVEPYSSSRIFWDINTQTTIFSPGNYGRLIELKNGRLLAVAQVSGGISSSVSTDKGGTWSTPVTIALPPDGVALAVPDLLQLSDGTILLGYNPRPEAPYSEERKFGIRVRRSADNGASWSNEIKVYDAHHTFNNGCWEPVFLELPSGEVQLYFANENDYQTTNEQNISMCRSFDKGVTWSEREIISYRAGFRDGMPAPLLLKDKNEIVIAIEDNGYTGYSPKFLPTTVRTSLSDNWSGGFVSGTSPKREYALDAPMPSGHSGAAPYIRQLPNGETILSYQGTEGRTDTSDDFPDMFVLVGNREARKFKAKSTPFSVPMDKRAKWNSVSVIDTGIVVAVTSTNINTSANSVMMMKGYPVSNVFAKFGTITVDGQKTAEEKWTNPRSEQLVMGNLSKSRWTVDFLYDNNYLYFTARVIDREIINTGTTNDGLRLLLDIDDLSTAAPQTGTFNIFFDTNGTVKLWRGANGSWNTDTNTSGIKYSINIVENRYYILEAAIPWSLFGKTAPVNNQRMALAVELFNRSASSYIIEGMPDALRNSPHTWMNFWLLANATDLAINKYHKEPIIKVHSNSIEIECEEDIQKIQLFSMDGKEIYSNSYLRKNKVIIPCKLNPGLICILFSGGKVVARKVIK